MKKTILTLSLLTVVLFGVQAQTSLGDEDFLNPLYTGVPSLSIAPDARAGAMGDVGAATTPDVYSQHWNPAKYAFMDSPAGFAFSFTPWLSNLVEDINLSYLCGYWKWDDLQAISASFRYFSLGRVLLKSHADDDGFTAYPNEFAVDLAYSRKLGEKFSASVGFRFIRSDLNIPVGATDGGSSMEMHPALSYAVDISAYYRTPLTFASGDGYLSFGANISNFGAKVTYDDLNYNFLPTNLRIGGSFEYPFDSYNSLSINADVNKLLIPTKNDMSTEDYNNISALSGVFKSFSDAPGGFKEEMQEILWAVGLEYSYNKQFFVRAGYSHENINKGNRKYFTVGAGFKLTMFELNAGYVIAATPANPLDQTLRFSLGFDIFGIRDLFN